MTENNFSHPLFEPQKFQNKKCLVLGFGKSGIWACKLIERKITSNIIVSDKKRIKTKYQFIIEDKIDEDLIKDIDFTVKSPGITYENPVIKLLQKLSKPIFSEIEVALSFSKTNKTIMITGTNGKSTTTYLTHLIVNEYLSKKHKKSILCGNIGNPVSKEILKANKDDFLVIEISSYQLEDSNYIKPNIGVILNITPDHLEHHGNMENYIKAKFKIFSFMDETSTLIINSDDPILKKIKESRFKILRFSIKDKSADAFLSKKRNKIIIKNVGEIKPADIPGEHNIYNQMASILAAITAGVDIKTIQKVLSSFKGLEHRIEFVREYKGIKFYNDSKATNVDSTLTALKAIGKKKNIYLILGGLHKGMPYTPLIPMIKKYVKAVITIGSASKIIENDLIGKVKIINAGKLKKAVDISAKIAKKNDIVLLSPACASFDQFKNFEDRGRQFKKFVNLL